jgi:hypothetical protein
VMPRFRRYKGRAARITAGLPSRTIQSRIPRMPISAGCPALVCFRWVKPLSSRSRCPRLDRPGAQLDRICEGGDVVSPLGQGQGSADLERQAVRERGGAIQMTCRLSPRHDDAPCRAGSRTSRPAAAGDRRARRRAGRSRGPPPPAGQPHHCRRADYPCTFSAARWQGTAQGPWRTCPSRPPSHQLCLLVQTNCIMQIEIL